MALTIIERNVQLDVYDHDLTPSKIKAIALDSKTRYVGAEIHNGGQTYDVGQNTGVTLTIIRPDKTGVQITGSTFQYTVGEGESVYGAYAELTQTALAISGTLLAQFMLTSGEQILRTEIFTINNGVALDATVSEWAGEYQGYNLDELVQDVNTAVATVEAMEQDVSELKSGLNGINAKSYVINMFDYFWAGGYKTLSSSITNDNDAINKYLVVSGNEGDDILTIDESSPLAISALYTGAISGILEYSDGEVDLVSLYNDNGSLSIYPPLKADISLAKIYSTAVSIHLTAQGYKYYTDSFYNSNKKYSTKTKAISQYNPYQDPQPDNPLTKIGSYWWGKGYENVVGTGKRAIEHCTKNFLNMNFTTGATENSPKGFEWEVQLDRKSGYFEMYLGGRDGNNSSAELATGLEFNIEFYLDGVLSESIVKKTKKCEPIRFDFENAQTGKVKLYVTSGASTYSACMTQATWWVTNEQHGNIFEPYKVPCLLMDSWGVYCNNAVESRLSDLLTVNGMTGFVVNNSLGGMTSNWGVANFFEKAWSEHPSYMITDFQINDVNAGVTEEQYISNMETLIDASVNNKIIPIVVLNALATTNGDYSSYVFPLITALTKVS